ncbi:hypothetical protein B0T22DRAFT_288443 [Podospora appendiculata]|uniref:Uncharacterized protein n=1 Tax=Podospora appendiculata TaxID=314037 RepID=A0AAE0X1N1_9PEZI|nr:hypothetical protein B0T22DRAFT_288443 [Podospora appendiculata]
MLPSGSSVRATLRRNRIQSLIENQQDSASRRRMAVSILSLRDGEKHAYLALIVPGLRHPMVHPDILPFLGMRWLELPPGHFWEPFMSPIGIIDPIRFTRLSLEHKPRQIGFMCENFLVLPDEAPKRDIDIYISEEFLTNHMSAGPPYNPGGNGHEYDPVSRQIPTGISSPAPGPDAANSSSHVFSQLQSKFRLVTGRMLIAERDGMASVIGGFSTQ